MLPGCASAALPATKKNGSRPLSTKVPNQLCLRLRRMMLCDHLNPA